MLYFQGELSSCEVLKPSPEKVDRSQEQLVEAALASPVASPSLSTLAVGKRNAVIIISDHTRPVPSRVILPPMLRELRRGNPEMDITLLVATGCHRWTSEQELRQKLGDEIFSREKILIHDCDSEDMVTLGTLPSGIPLRINGVATRTDLLVSEGFVEPHFFAGFSGGRKSVLPGICARETVMANHCAAFIDSPYARNGNLSQNPIHEDMAAAAKMAGLAFIVNVVLDDKKQVVAAAAGNPEQAHARLCGQVARMCGIKPAQKADVVITSNGGAPLDQNIYQVVKSLSTAAAAVKPVGTIIVCAECVDGTGGEQFFQAMRDCASPGDLLAQIRQVAPADTVPDQWQYQILCRILQQNRVIFVTRPELEETINAMKMVYSPSLEQAIRMAGSEGHILVIPDGVSAIVL